MKKIIVSVTNDLTTDQRVAKVCNTLYNNDFEILLVGRKRKNSLPITRDYATKRLQLYFNNGFLFYAEYNLRLFFLLLFTKKDILLSNDLDTLLPNYISSILQKKTLVYDSHELFSEVPELVNRSLVKRVWVSLEKILLPKLNNCYTVCKSIADYYDKRYQTNFKIICNYPHPKTLKNGKSPFEQDEKKTILYQGAINVGRGLELMIKTMSFLPNYQFIIAGKGDIELELKKLITKEKVDNVKFLGLLEPAELDKITPYADLGISLEEDLGMNYRFALPNKIFDYIQAEIPILISDLPEMKQVVLDYKVGEIVTYRKPEIIAKQIIELLKKDFSVPLKKAKKEYVWQDKKLVELFNNLR